MFLDSGEISKGKLQEVRSILGLELGRAYDMIGLLIWRVNLVSLVQSF
jgi:hypothetical protein